MEVLFVFGFRWQLPIYRRILNVAYVATSSGKTAHTAPRAHVSFIFCFLCTKEVCMESILRCVRVQHYVKHASCVKKISDPSWNIWSQNNLGETQRPGSSVPDYSYAPPPRLPPSRAPPPPAPRPSSLPADSPAVSEYPRLLYVLVEEQFTCGLRSVVCSAQCPGSSTCN